MPRADRHNGDDHQHGGDDDGVTEPLRLIQPSKAIPLQPCEYASWIFLSVWEIALCDQEAAMRRGNNAKRRGLKVRIKSAFRV
jgi:hypothetical protein